MLMKPDLLQLLIRAALQCLTIQIIFSAISQRAAGRPWRKSDMTDSWRDDEGNMPRHIDNVYSEGRDGDMASFVNIYLPYIKYDSYDIRVRTKSTLKKEICY